MKNLSQEIRWSQHIGIACDPVIVAGELFEVGQLADFCIRTGPFGDDHQLCIAFRVIREQLADDVARWVLVRSHGKQHLKRAGIVLCEPTFQAGPETRIGTLDRFQKTDPRMEPQVGLAPMQGKLSGSEVLPDLDQQRQSGKAGRGQGQQHSGLGMIASGGIQAVFRPAIPRFRRDAIPCRECIRDCRGRICIRCRRRQPCLPVRE